MRKPLLPVARLFCFVKIITVSREVAFIVHQVLFYHYRIAATYSRTACCNQRIN